MTAIAKKITIGGINGVRKGFKGIKEKTLVARIYGRCTGATVEDGGATGAYKKFVGEFRGVNADGEVTMAPVAYLPGPADDLLFNTMKQAEGAAVDFGFDFFVVPNEDAVLGYEYRCEPLIEAAKSEPLAALENAFANKPGPQKKQLALEAAPAAEAPAAAAPAAKGKK